MATSAGDSAARTPSPANAPWARDTVLRRMIGFGILIAVPLLALIVVGFTARFRSDRDHTARLLRISRQTSGEQVNKYIDSLRQRLGLIDAMPAVRTVDPEDLHRIFRQFLDLHPEFLNMVLIERNGDLVYSETFPVTQPPQNYASSSDIGGVLGTQGFAVSNAGRGQVTRRWGCAAALPCTAHPNLLLGAPFDLQRLSEVLFLAPDEHNMSVTVLDANGVIVLSSVNPATRIGMRHPSADAIAQALAGGRDTGEIMGHDDRVRTYNAGRVPGLRWIVLASLPTEDIYRDAWHNLWRALAYLLVAGGAFFVLATAYARSLTRPISALAAAVRAQTEGRSEEPVPEAGPREIAETARAFNLMVSARRQAEEDLRESERRHRELFQSNPHPMYVYDLGTLRILDVNEAALRHYGYTRDEFLRLTLADIRPAEDTSLLLGYIDQLRSGRREENAMTVVVRHRKKTGEIITVEVTSYQLRQAGAHARLVLAHDITEQLHAAQALKESEQRYRTVVDQTGQIVYDIDLPSGRIQWFGSAAVPAITGYPLEEFRRFDVPRVAAHFHPDDRAGAGAYYERSQHAGGAYHLEYRFRHRDGRYRLIEDVGVYLPDATGKSVRRLGRLSDITDRRQALVALRQVIDLVPHFIYAKDADGRYVLANKTAARAYGVTQEQLIGKTDAELAPVSSDAERFAATDREVLETGRIVRTPEEKIVTRDGTELYLSTVKMPFQMPGVDRPAVLGVSVDITELKHAEASRQQMEKKLLETQKLESLGVLAGGIAHDFNNLLTGILGNAGLAQLELPSGHQAAAYLEHIEKASLRAAELCKQMLAYSGKGRFQVQRVDLNELVEDTVKLLNISISKKATLRLALHRPLLPVQADAIQLRQVLMNLVINASEALGDRPGNITVSTGRVQADSAYLASSQYARDLPPGEYMCFEVSDDGCGMDRATVARIFDPFFTTKFTGRGLGLAAVLGIVRGHQGAIKVYSERERGTTFKILLPAADGRAEPLAAAPAAPAKWRGHGRVLVVDDEDTVRQVAVNMLQYVGFEPVPVADGEAAIERYRQDPEGFALVLLDLTMPRIDGEETFRQLRLIRPDVRAVLMSGFNKVDAINRFVGKGLAGFLQKPFEVDAFTAELRRVLEPPPS